jgi:hypothetical protein
MQSFELLYKIPFELAHGVWTPIWTLRCVHFHEFILKKQHCLFSHRWRCVHFEKKNVNITSEIDNSK